MENAAGFYRSPTTEE
jgi:hypothetical protein